MSKWVPFSSAIALSASACIQSRKASLPGMRRAGSASSAATASSTRGAGAGDLAGDRAHLAAPAGPAPRSPTRTSRAGRPWRRGSTARRSSYRSGPAASFSRPRGASSVRRNSPKLGGGRGRRRGAAAQLGGERARRRRGRSARPWKKLSRAGSVQASHCSATSTIWARALTLPSAGLVEQRPLVLLEGARERAEPGRDVGDRLLALGRHQVEGHPQAVQRAGDDVDRRWPMSPASSRASSRPSRSCIASLATCSASVSGSIRSSSARVRAGQLGLRLEALRARGRRVLSSWPVMPTKVAPVGLSGAHSVDVAVGEVINLSHAADPTGRRQRCARRCPLQQPIRGPGVDHPLGRHAAQRRPLAPEPLPVELARARARRCRC